MGRIRDKHEKNKRKEDDNDPLSGDLGNRDEKNRDFDLDNETIKDKQKKK